MRRVPSVGEKVRITNSIGKDLDDDRRGRVVGVDGYYVLIRLNKSSVVVERYPNELTED